MVKKQIKKLLKKPKIQKRSKKTVVKKPEIKVRTINAEDRILGRLSTEVAVILRGKDKPNFRPNILMGDKVIITNAKKIKVTGNKMDQKIYYHHTGYLGHLKSETMREVFEKDPRIIIKRAIWGMLPKNKLRKEWIKNLEIRKEE